MNTKALYFVVGLLIAGLIGGGIWMYQEQHRDGVEISVDRNGVSIERN